VSKSAIAPAQRKKEDAPETLQQKGLEADWVWNIDVCLVSTQSLRQRNGVSRVRPEGRRFRESVHKLFTRLASRSCRAAESNFEVKNRQEDLAQFPDFIFLPERLFR
jgi:hypothetical protein